MVSSQSSIANVREQMNLSAEEDGYAVVKEAIPAAGARGVLAGTLPERSRPSSRSGT